MKPIGSSGTHRPHPEEAHRSRVYPRSAHQVRKSATADLRCAVSKDGRWLGLACGCPSRRAQSFEARAPSGARAPQDDVRAPQDEVDDSKLGNAVLRLARGNGIGGSHVRDRPIHSEAAYGDLAGRQPFAELEQPRLGGEIALQRLAQEIDAQIDGHRERHRPDRSEHRDVHGKIGKGHHGGTGDGTAGPERCLPERLTPATAVLPDGFDEEAALRVEDLGKFGREETLKLADRHQDRHSPPPPNSRTLPRHKLLYAVIPGPRASERSQESITTSRAVATRRMNHRLGLWIPGSLASR